MSSCITVLNYFYFLLDPSLLVSISGSRWEASQLGSHGGSFQNFNGEFWIMVKLLVCIQVPIIADDISKYSNTFLRSIKTEIQSNYKKIVLGKPQQFRKKMTDANLIIILCLFTTIRRNILGRTFHMK